MRHLDVCMRNCYCLLLMTVCVMFFYPTTAIAEIGDMFVLKSGAPLHGLPDVNSTVYVKAEEGWILHAFEEVTAKDNTRWYNIWEIDSDLDDEISYWYVHHAYQTDSLYVRADDVRRYNPEDNLFFLEKQGPSGTNLLGRAGLNQIVSCLQAQPDKMQWLRDVFFYQTGVLCFDLIGPRASGDFYNLSPLERTIGASLDIRPHSTIVSSDVYSLKEQFFLNPMIAHWITENFIGLKITFPDIFAKSKSVYEKNKYIARSFVYANQYLTRYANFDEQVQAYKEAASAGMDMIDYLKRFKPAPEQGYDNVRYDFDGEGWLGYRDGYNRFRFAVGFWLRRGIDGSAQSFKTAMDGLMREYDADWYSRINQ